MCIALKYGVWNVQQPQMNAVNALVGAGYSPLTAMILSSRGMTGPQDAKAYLDCSAPMPDPYLLKDMEQAVNRVRTALARREKIAVFGDYDVDYRRIGSSHMAKPYIVKKPANIFDVKTDPVFIECIVN